MNKTTLVRNLLAILAIVGMTSAAPAAVLFTETFSYPNGRLTSVSGGLWTQSEGNGGPLNVNNGKVTLYHIRAQSPFPTITGEDVSRGFSALTAGQTVYAGLDVSASGNSAGTHFAAFSGTTKLFITPVTGSDFTFGIGNESTYYFPTVSWPSGFTFNTTHRVVMSYEFDTGASKLWVDPVNESSTYVSMASTASRPKSPFSLRQYATPEGTPPAAQVLDNLVVGTTFDEVLAIPGSTLPGDYSGNGTVGPEDYDVWKADFGTSNLAADGNGNGIVDAADYSVWRDNLGAALGSSGSAAGIGQSVPEPASVVFIGIGVAAAAVLSFRRARWAAIRGNKSALLAVLLFLGVASTAPAAVLFSETFSYPDGHLASAPPTGGVSGGLWIASHSSGGFAVGVSIEKVTLRDYTHPPSAAPPLESVSRGFSPLAAGQTIYAGLDVSASGNSAGAYFAAFMWEHPQIVGRIVGTRLLITPASGSDFTLGIGNDHFSSIPTVSWPSGLTFDTTYQVVMSYEFDTGSSKLWVNPVNESSTHVSFTDTATRTMSAFQLRQYWTSEGTPPAAQVLDNLVVGTTFDEVLTIPGSTLPGDYSGNGTVGPEDYDLWRANFGSTNLAADGNGNGIVDAADYVLWRDQLGATTFGASSSLESPSVPEPTSIATTIIAAVVSLGVLCRRISRQTRG